MTNSEALQETGGDTVPAPPMSTREFSRKEVQLLKRTICKGATDEELSMFIQNCKRYGLDPFTGQIHAVKRWDSDAGRKVMKVQVGIDGFRLIADRTGKWRGTQGPFWCGPDGKWTDVWLKDEHPAAAKVGVLRGDFSEPRWGIARWDAYVATKKGGDPTFMWQKMPAHMLAKCAEALALRSAFPNDLSGLYTDAEMQQAGDVEKRTYNGPDPDEVETVGAEVVDDTKPDTWYEEAIEYLAERATSRSDLMDHADVVPDKSHPLSEWPEEWWDKAFDALENEDEESGKEQRGSRATKSNENSSSTSEADSGTSNETPRSEEEASSDRKYDSLSDAIGNLMPSARDAGAGEAPPEKYRISEKQRKRMYAIAKDNDWKDSWLDRLVKDELGFGSKNHVPYGDAYDEICDALEDQELKYWVSRDPDTLDMFEEEEEATDNGLPDSRLPADFPKREQLIEEGLTSPAEIQEFREAGHSLTEIDGIGKVSEGHIKNTLQDQ